MMRYQRRLLTLALASAAALATVHTAAGQTSDPIPLQVQPADQVDPVSTAFQATGPLDARGNSIVATSLKPGAAGTNQGGQPHGFFPSDLSHSPSGATVNRAQLHVIYINQPPSHFGNVAQFLSDLGQSDYMHIVDQYVGAHDPGRYTVGTSFQATVTLPPGAPLRLAGILQIVHAAASITGSGYGHIYQLMLPKGMDTCAPWGCYQPDRGAIDYCGYHEAVTYNDAVGHVIFTVQPYSAIHGCEQPPYGTANNQVTDSENANLAHETLETITDPDVNSWYVATLDILYGQEAADLCHQSALYPDGYYYGQAKNIQLNGNWYTVPGMYSNRDHACVFTAPH
ncbi:hypothetical protein DYQ86_04490 [Acidobacteria bacterium AB60]|nr:hypothetical protein DYQ86_04490 [Acidobacteria bacterium AB60]